MANRLPITGSDNGTWGQILNDYLTVEHNADGTLKKAADIAAAQATANAAIPATQKGAASGVATLDGSSKLTAAQLPTNVATKSASSGDTGKAIDAFTGSPLTVLSGTVLNTPTVDKQVPRWDQANSRLQWRKPDRHNVQTYGAVGDARKITVTVGSGSTAVTGTGFTSADNGKTIVLAGAGASGGNLITTATYVSATQLTLAAPTVAAPTGGLAIIGTDDTAAVQAAINAAFSAQIIYFPKPDGPIGYFYLITASLTIVHPGFMFEGASMRGAQIAYAGTGYCIEIGTDNGQAYDANDYSGFEGFRMQHLTFMGALPTQAMAYKPTLYMPNAGAVRDWRGGDMQFQNVQFINFDTAFWGIQSDLNVWENIFFNSCRVGAYLGPRSDQLDMTAGYFIYCDRAIDLDRVGQARFRGTSFIDCGTQSINPIRIRSAWTVASRGINFNACWFESLISDSRSVTVTTALSTALTGSGFVAADTGRTIAIPGAGVAGATLTTTVTYVSATQLTLATAASTVVTSVASQIGDGVGVEAFIEVGVGDSVQSYGVKLKDTWISNNNVPYTHTKYLVKTGNATDIEIDEVTGDGVSSMDALVNHAGSVNSGLLIKTSQKHRTSTPVVTTGSGTPQIGRLTWGSVQNGWLVDGSLSNIGFLGILGSAGGNVSGQALMILDSGSNKTSAKILRLRAGGSDRWALGANLGVSTAESSGDLGNDLHLQAYNDAGSSNGVALIGKRSAGTVVPAIWNLNTTGLTTSQVDSSFLTAFGLAARDGYTIVDGTNHLILVRQGGAWYKSAAMTAV